MPATGFVGAGAQAPLSFFQPGTEAAIGEGQINRQRAMALALLQQSQQMPQGEMVSGHYVAPSILASLGTALKGVGGVMMNQNADTKEQGLARQLMANKASESNAIMQAMNGTPSSTQQVPTNAPSDSNPDGNLVESAPVTTPAQGPDMNRALAIAMQSQNPTIAGMAPEMMKQQMMAAGLKSGLAAAGLGPPPAAPAGPPQAFAVGDPNAPSASQGGPSSPGPSLSPQPPTIPGMTPQALALMSSQYPQLAEIGKTMVTQQSLPDENIRPGGYTKSRATGEVTQFPVASPGHRIVFQNGTPIEVPMQNGLNAISAAAAATKAGTNQQTVVTGYQGSKPIYRTEAQNVATANGAPAPGYANEPQMRATAAGDMGGDPQSAMREIQATKQQLAANPSLDAGSKKMLQDHIAEMQQQLSNIQSASPAAVSPVAPELDPGTKANADAAQQASAQTMQDSYKRLQGGNNTANTALDAIDKMQALAAKKNPYLTAGVLGTNQSAVNPDAAEYEKQRAFLNVQLAGQNGSGGTDAGRALTGDSIPDFGKPQAAIKDGLGSLRNQVVAQQLKANVMTPVYQAGDSKAYTTLENQFDHNISPSMVPLLTMPGGPARAALLKSASNDPAMKAKLTWAAEHGLLK